MTAALPLEAELAGAIDAAARGGPSLDFESWALRIFAHQFERNAPYRTVCERRGVTPEVVARWEDVPPVPTAAFRHHELTCGPPEAIFRTSGTSAGPGARGSHLVPHLALYRVAALAAFREFVLPDGARPSNLFLLPPPALRPESSLVRMCAWVGDSLGGGHDWFVGEGGLEIERLLQQLGERAERGETALLAGPTAGFADLFDACRARGRTFRLGPGSRVMDTGGAKGLRRPLSRAGFFRECWTHLGVAGYCCVNEYGMTELCSQRYDSALVDRFRGRNLAPRRLLAPPWLRTRVVDPDTLEPVPPGTTGLLCHHDLANAGSVSVVLTEDLGHTIAEDGIEFVGRVAGAIPRGCGLLLAELGPG